jgi:hypothetical protein
MHTMPYNMKCHLWPNREERFFPDLKLSPLQQIGMHCVSTSLGILTGTAPEQFQGIVNTQDPTTLSYYTSIDPNVILGNPNDEGWVCGSHIVVMHRDKILDPAIGTITSAIEHHCKDFHTKRIFRIVPINYDRSL